MGTEAEADLGAQLGAHALLDPDTLARLLGGSAPAAPVTAGTGVAYDSRKVRPGDVFFAWRGSTRHGIELAEEVLAKGAAFIVSDEPHPHALVVDNTWAAMRRLAHEARKSLAGPVIGVTGSAGKTTVKTLLTAALNGRSTPGNLNTVPPLLAAFVAAARTDAGLDAAPGDLAGEDRTGAPIVIELGVDHPGEMAELTGFTRPDHGLITTIGESHLSRLGDVAAVAREKQALLAAASGVRVAGAGAARHLDPGVLSRTHVTHLLGSGPLAGLACPPAGEVTGRLEGRTLRTLGTSLELPWPGTAMAENALLVVSAAWLLGVDASEALQRMARAPLEKGRLRLSRLGPMTLIDDSYNSNPLSAALALEVLREQPTPRAAFLGDMRELGDVSRQRHLELGEATRELDLVVAIGEESRAIAEANPDAKHVAAWPEAVELLELVPAGATVLVKGSRSLELENLVAAMTKRFVPERGETGSQATAPVEAGR